MEYIFQFIYTTANNSCGDYRL